VTLFIFVAQMVLPPSYAHALLKDVESCFGQILPPSSRKINISLILTLQFWLLEMEATHCVTNFIETDLLDDEPADDLPTPTGSEGNIRFRLRHRRRSGAIKNSIDRLFCFLMAHAVALHAMDKKGCCP
jgi:hypothetical protein